MRYISLDGNMGWAKAGVVLDNVPFLWYGQVADRFG